MENCPCTPNKKYDECCGPYLKGTANAPTAEALMRSRYTAYTLDDYDYVIRTCHSSTRPSKEDFEDEVNIDWSGLEIVDTVAGGENDTAGEVEFVARYKLKGKVLNQHERSEFVKEDGQWFYVEGEFVKGAPVRSQKTGRNQPCPCGSGKKFKKCCLNKN